MRFLLRFVPVTGIILSIMALSMLSACGNGKQQFALPQNGDQMKYEHAVVELNQKAQQYLNGGNTLAAVSRLESALDLIPNEPQTLSNLAIAYNQAERYEQSIDLYKKLLDNDPNQSGLYLKSLGINYEALGDRQLKSIDEAHIPPQSPQAEKIRKEAITTFENAMKCYEQAIADGKGLEKTDDLKGQIKAIQEQIQRIKTGAE